MMNICDLIQTHKREFKIVPNFWDDFDDGILKTISKKWEEVKYFDDKMTKHNDIAKIPNNKGGVYAFIVKPNIIPDAHLYLMYVGRAHGTRNQSLRKRCREYEKDKRPKIEQLVKKYGKYLYFRYLPLDDDITIDNVEKELINKLLPPCNDDIPDKDVKAAVKAF